jgi:predicted ArsR family transcriptional regulator
MLASYRAEIPDPQLSLSDTLEALCAKRTAEGFLAELRLTPTGWLLIENHCPIFAAASSCSALCAAEFSLFEKLLEGHATIERSDYLLDGARRCAYRIQPVGSQQ